MPNAIEAERIRMRRTVEEAMREASRTLADRERGVQGGMAAAIVTSNGYWTEDGDGEPVFMAYFTPGMLVAEAPVA